MKRLARLVSTYYIPDIFQKLEIVMSKTNQSLLLMGLGREEVGKNKYTNE